MAGYEVHYLGDTVLCLSARERVRGRHQILVHVRFSEFYDRFEEFSVYPVIFSFGFYLGQLSLPQALPRIVSLVASHLDAKTRQLCESRLFRFSLQAAAETATGSALEMLFDIGTFCSPPAGFANDLELMADWMLETPFEVEVEEEDIDDYFLEDSHGFGGIPASRSFIKSLESSPYGGGEGIREKQCMICLEDFDVGAEVSKMPCSHTFHNQCIVHWLVESHVCPICRNKMPTSSS